MLEGVAAAGLASSIITFGELAYKVGKRTRQFSQHKNGLPPELLRCKSRVEFLLSIGEDLKGQFQPVIDDLPIQGPPTKFVLKLERIFARSNTAATELLGLFESLERSSAFPLDKAIKTLSKEGRIARSTHELDQIYSDLRLLLRVDSLTSDSQVR